MLWHMSWEALFSDVQGFTHTKKKSGSLLIRNYLNDTSIERKTNVESKNNILNKITKGTLKPTKYKDGKHTQLLKIQVLH